MSKLKRKDIFESVLITAVVVGFILLFPILFVAFIRYGDWVINLLGMQ